MIMEKKIKIGLAFLLVCTVLVFLTVLYNYINQGINPPEISELEILIDLKSPNEGTIYITYPESESVEEDLDLFVRASFIAGDIIEDQYHMLAEEDPFGVEPLREDGGKATVSLNFFANNKSEFAGPVYKFKTQYCLLYTDAHVTLIFPNGYKPISGFHSFEDGRWRYSVSRIGGNNFEFEYKKIETENRNLSICDKIWQGVQHQKSKDWCYTDVAVDKKDISICEKIQNQDNKEGCYSGVAEAKQDILICNKIQDQDRKDECYVYVAKAKQDISICDEMEQNPYKAYKELCYSGVALAKRDPTICVQIQYQNVRDNCYFDIATIKENISICDKIQRNLNKELCYLQVATGKQDLSICDKIHDQDIKNLCFADLIETLTVNK